MKSDLTSSHLLWTSRSPQMSRGRTGENQAKISSWAERVFRLAQAERVRPWQILTKPKGGNCGNFADLLDFDRLPRTHQTETAPPRLNEDVASRLETRFHIDNLRNLGRPKPRRICDRWESLGSPKNWESVEV